MTDLKQLSYKAINLGKQLQAVIDIGEALDELGDLDQAILEATESFNKAQSESEDAKNDLAELKDNIKQVELDYSKSKKKYSQLIAETEQRCNYMLAQTRSESVDIVSVATVGANKILSDEKKEVAILTKKRNSLSQEIEKLQDELQSTRNDMLRLKERLS